MTVSGRTTAAGTSAKATGARGTMTRSAAATAARTGRSGRSASGSAAATGTGVCGASASQQPCRLLNAMSLDRHVVVRPNMMCPMFISLITVP